MAEDLLLKRLDGVARVWTIPQTSGIPTKPQAGTSLMPLPLWTGWRVLPTPTPKYRDRFDFFLRLGGTSDAKTILADTSYTRTPPAGRPAKFGHWAR